MARGRQQKWICLDCGGDVLSSGRYAEDVLLLRF